MKRKFAKIWCIILIGICSASWARGQDKPLRIGFQVSPVFSSIRNNNNLFLENGGNFGWKLGAISDIPYKDNISFTAGINFGFTEGGELLYEIGGNYLPNSDLSDPALQTGDKPLPDGVKINYKVTYLEFPFGLKIRTNEKNNKTFFLEAPVISLSFVTKGRGDIETEDAVYEQENVYKDLCVGNIFLGLGGGMEYALNANNSLIGGLYYQRGILDITKDDGYSAILNPEIIPTYLRLEDISRSTIGNFIVFIGILF